MAEREKKPWQISLKRLLGAMAIVCVTLGISLGNYITGDVAFIVFILSMGIGCAIGFLIDARWGPLAGAAAGFTCVGCPIYILLCIWRFLLVMQR